MNKTQKNVDPKILYYLTKLTKTEERICFWPKKWQKHTSDSADEDLIVLTLIGAVCVPTIRCWKHLHTGLCRQNQCPVEVVGDKTQPLQYS